jgi:molybdopterin synthase sulfur carrier subunit
MRIQIKAFARIRDILGERVELDLPEGITVGGLLAELVKKYGRELEKAIFNSKTGKLQPYIRVLLNGRDVDFLDGLNTRLNSGDVLALFPPVAGG